MARTKRFPRDRRPGRIEPRPGTQAHRPGSNNYCQACGERFPCPGVVGGQGLSTQIVPTATVRARDLEHQLHAIREALQAFEHELRDPAHREPREPHRPALVAVALEHVQQAMDALEMAGRD